MPPLYRFGWRLNIRFLRFFRLQHFIQQLVDIILTVVRVVFFLRGSGGEHGRILAFSVVFSIVLCVVLCVGLTIRKGVFVYTSMTYPIIYYSICTGLLLAHLYTSSITFNNKHDVLVAPEATEYLQTYIYNLKSVLFKCKNDNLRWIIPCRHMTLKHCLTDVSTPTYHFHLLPMAGMNKTWI